MRINENKLAVITFEGCKQIVLINYVLKDDKLYGDSLLVYNVNFLFNITKKQIPQNNTLPFLIDNHEIEDIQTIENYKLDCILDL